VEFKNQFQTLKVSEEFQQILVVTLNRPEVRNAINHPMMQELLQLWQSIGTNPKTIRCIILTGSGDKAFCAGADLKARLDLSLETWQQQHETLQQAMLAMVACPIPIIAAVNGAAYGGGLELTLASDFAYAADTVMFAQSEVKLGIIPGAMGTQNLPRACGLRRAKELCFTADAFSAAQAYEWGIINKVCAPAELVPAVLATAKKIAASAPIAVREAKQAMNMSQNTDLKSGFAYEVKAYQRALNSEDRVEGIKAFNEKRKPSFKNL
jgi:enoyl-CoA hydratase